MGAVLLYWGVRTSMLGMYGPPRRNSSGHRGGHALTGLSMAFSNKVKPLRDDGPTSGAVTRRPRGPMDKASAYGAGDCRFESCQGHYANGALKPLQRKQPFSPGDGGSLCDYHNGCFSSMQRPRCCVGPLLNKGCLSKFWATRGV